MVRRLFGQQTVPFSGSLLSRAVIPITALPKISRCAHNILSASGMSSTEDRKDVRRRYVRLAASFAAGSHRSGR
jgi:hypothetical protein